MAHKILVIDDSNVIRTMVRDMLPKGNFEVLEAKDGVQGLNLIQQERPNLIMLDFLLPKMSGWEVFQNIQTQPALQAIPLVLMSGRKEEVTEKLQEPFEYFEFVQKPFDQAQLITAIKTAMAKAKRRPPAGVAPVPATAPVASSTATIASGSSADIQALNAKIATMQAEIDGMKRQIGQILNFIKQKMK